MTAPRKPVLSEEEIKSQAWKWGREQPSIHLPDLVVGFENGARFAIAAAEKWKLVNAALAAAKEMG